MERVKKKRIGAEGETIHPTQAIGARMGEEEENIKQKEEQKKQTNRERAPNPATMTIWSPLTSRMDHTVSLF